MKKLFQFTAILVLVCNIGTAKAQHHDHLAPVDGFFNLSNRGFEYHSRVRRILFDGLSDRPEARFQIMPSYTPESVLDIQFDRDNDRHYIVYHIAERNIWFNALEEISINKFRTEIDKESVDLIQALFRVALAQVRFPPAPVPEPFVMEDGSIEEFVSITEWTGGIRYFFTTQQFGTRQMQTGYVWSHNRGYKMRRLVNIGYQLIELAKSENEIVSIDETLRIEMEDLINDFR